MGLSHTIFEIRQRFQSKLQNFHISIIFYPLLMGFPLELLLVQESEETRMMWLSDGPKSFKIGLAV